MPTAFEIAWWIWAPISAWITQAVIVWLFRPRFGQAAYGLGCVFWATSFIATIAFTMWTGMEMYGFNASDPWQWAGWFALFISPFGLPLLFGAPVVCMVQLAWFGWKAYKRCGATAAGEPDANLG